MKEKLNWHNIVEEAIGGIITSVVLIVAGYIWRVSTGEAPASPWLPSGLAALALIIAGLLAWKWQTFREFLSALGQRAIVMFRWTLNNWQLVFGLVLLFSVAYGIIALTPTLWTIVLLCCLILATVLLIRHPLKSYSDKPGPITRDVALATSSSFEYDFSNLDAWKPLSEWSPEFKEHGLKLVDHDHLRKVLLNDRLPEFVNGKIECEVYLEKGALFNVMLRGDISNDFYMARLDTRAACWDCFLIRPRGKGWKECNAINTLKHHSPYGQWLKMRVIADGKRLSLYRDDVLVDEIDDAEVTSGTIGLFAELSNVYVRKVRVLPEPTRDTDEYGNSVTQLAVGSGHK